MKSLFLATFILLSHTAFSSERTFECSAKYVFGNKEKASIVGTITSESSLADVTYSIDDQTEFNSVLLTKERNVETKKFAFYQQFQIKDTNYTLFMPERMDTMFFFTAIVGNGKTFERLECTVEN